MLSIPKKHVLLVKRKENSDVLSCSIVRKNGKVIYVFKLKCKNLLFREIYSMKNCLSEVNLDSSVTIAKNTLVNIFTGYYTESIIHGKY